MDVLTKGGFNLYELDDFDEEVLPKIEDINREIIAQEMAEKIPSEPYEIEEGSQVFYLDLRQALNAYPELTTKKILRPFFNTIKFVTLSLVFDHLPPWLPDELKARDLDWSSQDMPGGVLINISGQEGKICSSN
jgi:hypothetical protein